MEIIRVRDASEAEILFLDVLRYEASVIPAPNQINMLLPGGRSAAPAVKAVKRAPGSLLKRLHIYLTDERLSEPYNKDDLLAMGLEELIESSRFPIEHLHAPAVSQDLQSLRNAYEESLPKFSLIFAGVGEDGHTASLFPGSSVLASYRDVEIITDSPKPPPKRITLTPHCFRRYRSTSHVYVLFFGEEKQHALNLFMTHDDPLICPATLFKGFTHLTVVTDLEV